MTFFFYFYFWYSGSKIATNVYPSLVNVKFDLPYLVSGVTSSSCVGVGVVIDSMQGLVICDRTTITLNLGDVELCIAGSIIINAKIIFLHPIHNFAIVQYNPKLLGTTPIQSAIFSKKQLLPGDITYYVGLSSSNSVLSQKCCITRKEPFIVSLDARPPRYTARNVELLHVDKVSSGLGGVFCDSNGHIQALWSSFSYQGSNKKNREVFRGLPVELIQWSIEALTGCSTTTIDMNDELNETKDEKKENSDTTTPPAAITNSNTNSTTAISSAPLTSSSSTLSLPIVYDLQVVFTLISHAKACEGMGLSNEWCIQLAKKHSDVRQVLQVSRVVYLSLSEGVFKTGDLLLSIDNEACCTFRDVELLIHKKKKINAIVSLFY